MLAALFICMAAGEHLLLGLLVTRAVLRSAAVSHATIVLCCTARRPGCDTDAWIIFVGLLLRGEEPGPVIPLRSG